MSDIPFHLTRMGRDFYEVTMRELVREIARLNDNLERVQPPASGSATEIPSDEAPGDRARPG